MKHLKYLKYVLKHKWFVFVECAKHGKIWRGIVHDLSKFRPSEWFPYVNWFYGKYGSNFKRSDYALEDGYTARKHIRADRAFDRAWLLHQHRNPHHWQFWLLRKDNGSTQHLTAPLKYTVEMFCDWVGAGLAITGKRDVADWYKKNREKIDISGATSLAIVLMIKKENY